MEYQDISGSQILKKKILFDVRTQNGRPKKEVDPKWPI